MNVQVLQHVPFEGLGTIRTWLEQRHADIRFTHLWKGEALPELDDLDLIVVMGGPMSVNDEAEHPWLRHEKAWLTEAVARETPMLGVCLGAQLMAVALGSEVRPNPHKEIGWFEVQGLEDRDVLRLPDSFLAFQWHGQTFDLPAGAHHLARSQACEHQAFQYGRHVIGLQFHLEMTPPAMEGLIQRLGHDLTPGPYVQTPDEMRAQPAASYQAADSLVGQVVAYLLGPV